ncbi:MULTISPECIES: CPBP family intramembrane glutamic endopeptidase [Kordiimonas]|jgi:membrane protease YdiL (CAAX protease family)|uniref:CPBP family intramembrane glutamic endopeptidase n=1 Tax=Kordiimonas TaxID=288021 RepID=UPI0025803F4E|nr:CPBP family intramembrane glutamic endopeptidase [Kordiimonas sp. UBA4487]
MNNNGPKGQLTFQKEPAFDLLAIIATLVVVKQALIPVTLLYAGPISTFSAMLVGTLLLRRRGMGWRDLGFRKPDSWLGTLGLTALVFIGIVLTSGLGGALVDLMFEDIGTSGRFDHIKGDPWAYLVIMVLTWTHAAIFEEALFRAFVINRALASLGGGRAAQVIALLFSAVFFGYRHYYYKGMNGALTTGLIGLTLGLLYLWFGRRNIWPLVFGHGIINTIGMTSRFLGLKGD